MDLTDDQIADLKSLVRVGMDMHDIENWHNGEYSGDAGKFTDGAMIGIDLWVKQLCASQKNNTNDSALPISDVVGQSEQFMCYEYDLNGKSKPCKEQCKKCSEYQLRLDSA